MKKTVRKYINIRILTIFFFIFFLINPTDISATDISVKDLSASDPSLTTPPPKTQSPPAKRKPEGNPDLNTTPPKIKKSVQDSTIHTPSRRKIPPILRAYLPTAPQGQRKNASSPDQRITKITVEDELNGGSRRWVRGFPDQQIQEATKWHKKSAEFIRFIRTENIIKNFVPAETNFASARLTFLDDRENVEHEEEAPYVFISGWPATKNRKSLEDFSEHLQNLEKTPEEYKKYGIRAIARSYQGGTENTHQPGGYTPFKKRLINSMDKENSLDDQNRLLSHQRLNDHLGILKDKTHGTAAEFNKRFLHAEQAIRTWAKEVLETQKKKKLTGYLKKNNSEKKIILDICSFLDMCWTCGDSLTSTYHNTLEGEKIVVRCTGIYKYSGFRQGEQYYLRNHRKKFPGYDENIAYTPTDGHKDPTYRPYIANLKAPGKDS